jgi:hypothetical protein
MKTFIYKNGRPDHQEGYHDDLLMALAMGLWVVEHSFKNLERLEKQTKAMLSSWLGGANETKPVMSEKEKKLVEVQRKINPTHAAYKNVQNPVNHYMWLFSGLK